MIKKLLLICIVSFLNLSGMEEKGKERNRSWRKHSKSEPDINTFMFTASSPVSIEDAQKNPEPLPEPLDSSPSESPETDGWGGRIRKKYQSYRRKKNSKEQPPEAEQEKTVQIPIRESTGGIKFYTLDQIHDAMVKRMHKPFAEVIGGFSTEIVSLREVQNEKITRLKLRVKQLEKEKGIVKIPSSSINTVAKNNYKKLKKKVTIGLASIGLITLLFIAVYGIYVLS